MKINYLLIKLDNTFKKEKELNKDFSLFNFSLILKGLLSSLLSNYFLSILAPILVHWTHM
jgi:hypothetical protein